MKFILLSDLHLLADKPKARLDDAPTTQQKKLYSVLDDARKLGVDGVLQAGDFFDVPRSWRLISKYTQLLRVMEVPVYAVFGQHDTYMYSIENRSATNLGILVRAGLVKPLDGQPHMFESGNVMVYGCSYGEEIPTPIAKPGSNPVQILVIHRMILKDKLYPSQENMDFALPFLKRHSAYDLILCGDAHQHFLVRDGKRIICNTGPILRREATPEMFAHRPGFFVYDTDTRDETWYDLEVAPAEKVLSREHIERETHRNEQLELFINEVMTGDHTQSADLSFSDNLLRFLDDNKVEPAVRRIIENVMNEE